MMRFTLNLDETDGIYELKQALDAIADLGYDLDSITVNSFRPVVEIKAYPNVTSIHNTSMSHDGGLRP